MSADKANLDNFLSKVDEIESLIKDLAGSDDGSDHKVALSKADQYLENHQNQTIIKQYPARDNTGVNRTVINQAAFEDDSVDGQGITPGTSQEAFLAVLEHDAKERTTRKVAKRKEADVFKDKGNVEFKNGCHEQAVIHYTEALSVIKDYSALWTNRAQAYIKLGKFEEAVEDCDWALRISEKCLKAYVHKGKAYCGLKRYDEAIEVYLEAIKIEPSKQKTLEGYIRDTKLQKKTDSEEEEAKAAVDSGSIEAKGVVNILEKINKKDELLFYYSGGLRLLQHALVNTTERTLFRTSGGLTLTTQHHLIAKCFEASPRSLSQDEMDLCAATLEVFLAACKDNEENQRAVLELPDLPQQLERLLESKWKATQLSKQAALQILHLVSETEHLRSRLLQRFNCHRLVSALMTLMQNKSPTIGGAAAGLLNNLALDNRFKVQLRDKLEELLPEFESLMAGEQTVPLTVLTPGVSTLTNLCGDPLIRKTLAGRRETWKSVSTALSRLQEARCPANTEAILSILGLLVNLTLEASTGCHDNAVILCTQCCHLLSGGEVRVRERALSVMARVLPHSVEAVKQICEDKQVVPILLDCLKEADSPVLKPALRCLTACTQTDSAVCQQILDTPKGVHAVYRLVRSPDDGIRGNATLCLSHCCQLPEVSVALVDTNIVMDLLVHVRDGDNSAVKQNCAILIAKLTQAHPSHLAKLRELDGLGILHSIMKHIRD